MLSISKSRRMTLRTLAGCSLCAVSLLVGGCSGAFSGKSEYEQMKEREKSFADIIAAHGPDEAAVEDSFVHVNASSALKLGHARAAAMLAAALKGLSVAEYAPTLVKQAVTGKGSAEKEQVATMVRMLLPGSRAVADAADALAVAICHAHHAQTRDRIALRAYLRQHVADRRTNDRIGKTVELSRFGVHDDDARARRLRERNEAGHRIHLKAGADCEQQIRLRRSGEHEWSLTGVWCDSIQ